MNDFSRLPIGLFDSGMGGLTVFKALAERLPHEDLLYLGDTARLPYGTKGRDTIIRYTLKAAQKQVDMGVKILVIASNTATSAALDAVREQFAPLPVMGVVAPGAQAAAQASVNGHIVVVATEATISGGAYQQAIARIRSGGRKDTFAKADYKMLPGWSYASMWWISNDSHGAYAARGVHGQTLWIDPAADMVIARFGSYPVAANAANDPTSLPAYRAVANHLMATDKMPLLGQEWRIESLDGIGLLANSQATLQFLANGRLAGSATCNRILGSYSSEEGKPRLRIEPAGTTMMICPEALMNQERKLLGLLPQVQRYRIDASGALVLETANGKTILARR